MDTLVLPKPAYNVLRRLTGETRPDVALSIALKDLVRLRLESAQTAIKAYEEKYGMPLIEFKEAWEAGRVSARYSYEVEGDYWAWEAADSEERALRELIEAFFNEATQKTAYARIRDGKRIFGADKTGGWHWHPLGAPEEHIRSTEAVSFPAFLERVEVDLK